MKISISLQRQAQAVVHDALKPTYFHPSIDIVSMLSEKLESAFDITIEGIVGDDLYELAYMGQTIHNVCLHLSQYTMPSGNIEVTAYLT